MQLNVRDVSRLLKVPENRVYQWVTDGTLPAQRVNSQYYFNRDELLEWATQRRIEVVPELFRTGNRAASPEAGVGTALKTGGIFYDVPGTDRESALRAVVERMPLPDSSERGLLLSLLLAREAHGSTAIGDGIAIPHPRAPIIEAIEKPSITLCFFQHPVAYGASNGQPVQTVFALLSPHMRAHLDVLARLAHMLRDENFRGLIKQREKPEVLLREVDRLDAAMD
jgi:PTS system nitrogen regulatory IIA component